MTWTDAVDELDHAIRLALGGRGNDAIFAASRAIELYAADLLGLSLTELQAKKKSVRLQEADALRQAGLLTSEQAELLDGVRRVRNVVAHPPFTVAVDGSSLTHALSAVKSLFERDAVPLHRVAIRDLRTTDPASPAHLIAAVMASEDFTYVPVFADGEPVGTITERSIVELFADAGQDADYLDRTVGDVMKEPLSIHEGSATVHTLIDELQRSGAVLVRLRKGWAIYTLWDYVNGRVSGFEA